MTLGGTAEKTYDLRIRVPVPADPKLQIALVTKCEGPYPIGAFSASSLGS